MHRALEMHKEWWTRGKDFKRDPKGYISLHLLTAAKYAYENMATHWMWSPIIYPIISTRDNSYTKTTNNESTGLPTRGVSSPIEPRWLRLLCLSLVL